MAGTKRRGGFANVLVATDFSPDANRALGRAVRLPIRRDGTLTVLHVLPDALPPPLGAEAVAEARDRLARLLAARFRGLDPGERPRLRTRIGRGEVVTEILGHARRTRPDLLVIGRRGMRSGGRELGSRARQVVRHGGLPVLVVRARPGRGYRRPLVALDLEDASRRALELARELAAASVRRLAVVHACELPWETLLGRLATVGELARYRRQSLAQAREHVAAHLRSLDGTGLRLSVTIRCGEPREIIAAESRRRRPDLVALGSHGGSFLRRLFLGSVAEDVLRTARSDVLVAPPQ